MLAPAERRARLIAAYGIDLVVDVGANAGQYASDLRAAGYRGRIVSFEPLSGPFGALAAGAAADARWETHRLALGDAAGDRPMNVAEDTRNSSLLPVGDRHLRAVFVLVEAELSLLPVYGATASFANVTQLLARHGFEPVAFEGVLDDHETGEMLQADAIFRRSEHAMVAAHGQD